MSEIQKKEAQPNNLSCCPFCGEAELIKPTVLPTSGHISGTVWKAIRCLTCGAVGPISKDGLTANKLWGTRVIQLSSEVQKFAEAMQFKIDKNAHKENWPEYKNGERSWKTCDINFLLNKLEEEHAELILAISKKEPLINVKREAADVGNIAMMIADRLGAIDA